MRKVLYKKYDFKHGYLEKDYTHEGFFHQWISTPGGLFGMLETKDGLIEIVDPNDIKFNPIEETKNVIKEYYGWEFLCISNYGKIYNEIVLTDKDDSELAIARFEKIMPNVKWTSFGRKVIYMSYNQNEKHETI